MNPYNNQQNQQNQQHQQHVQVRTKKELGTNEQHLADLFANRDDGMDTFGNLGNLRYGILFSCVLLVKLIRGTSVILQVWANRSRSFGCGAEDGHELPQPVRNATAVNEHRASVL